MQRTGELLLNVYLLQNALTQCLQEAEQRLGLHPSGGESHVGLDRRTSGQEVTSRDWLGQGR